MPPYREMPDIFFLEFGSEVIRSLNGFRSDVLKSVHTHTLNSS